MKYDYAVLIGRFQLPHKKHFELMEKALETATNLIIAIGSSNVRRSLLNPFSYEQRMMLIEKGATEKVLKAFIQDRIRFVAIEDSWYSDQWWVEHVQRSVKSTIDRGGNIEGQVPKVCLVGCNKDDTTYYLEMFPQWDQIMVEQTETFAATDCRNAYYEFGIEDTRCTEKLYDFTTSGVIKALRYIPTQVSEALKTRFEFCKKYEEQWGKGPHYTSDPVVIKSGHVLLVKRKFEPDIGAWAFPGGFRNKNTWGDYEPAIDAAIRECREETGLELDLKAFKTSATFAKPFRDDRGDIKTTACVFDLGTGYLPDVKGSDDAEHAQWVPIADLTCENMMSDHYFIMRDALGKL